jgi:DNA helicase-2/ATP-dependent DNA helicase PcrA
VTSPTQPISAGPEPVPGLEHDPDATRIVREELKLLSMVHHALKACGAADVSAARGRAMDDTRLLELRDDVAVAKPEDLPALFEQMHHLGALRAQRGRSVVGSVDRESPYFGHMRLEEPVAPNQRRPGMPPKRRRDVLVGSRSYVDSNEGIRIVDWRHAPVSRIYYRYTEGDDYEEELGGRIVEGAVSARRGVSIVAGELVRVSAPQGTFVRGGDGLWKRVAVRRARLETENRWTAQRGVATEARLGVGARGELRQDKHLPAIAGLLDPRQFDLIARESAGLMVVQGSAGSGKTTVGVHRVAYLAFKEPQRFRPDNMLVVVPNEALMHYVSRVLPSLGVEGVPVSTFSRLATRFVTSMFPKLPSVRGDETPPVVSRAKSHVRMLGAIDGAVARIESALEARLRASMAKWPEGDRVVRGWEGTRTDGLARASVRPDGARTAEGGEVRTPPDMRLSFLSLWAAGKRSIAGVAAATDLPDVTRSAVEQFVGRERAVTRSVSDLWDEVLTSRELLGETLSGQPGFGTGQIEQVHTWCVRQTRVRIEGERDGEAPWLDAEDRALLLRCWQVLRGPIVDPSAKPIRFAHIFVDEVQDASPVELRVLLDLAGPDRCITLAGDVAQRMLDDGDERGEFDWDALLDGLGVPHTKVEPLQVSYRSTAEITEFARGVLGPLAHEAIPDTTRHGPPVELFEFASPGEAVAWLAEALRQLARDEPEANVALIARFPQQADIYCEGLSRAELPNVRRVAKQDFSWEPGVDVTDVRQTKGLEFDEVVLLETTTASYPVTPAARHALYIGATRASHQLWCVASDVPSKLVADAIGPEGAHSPD